MPPKKKMVPPNQGKVHVLNLSDKNENFKFVESRHVLAEVGGHYGKN
jgi:hypothetical protein